MINGLA
jgi:hypothetical protein